MRRMRRMSLPNNPPAGHNNFASYKKMLGAVFGNMFIFLILFLALWVLISMWIARRVNLPLMAVIFLGFIPYVNRFSAVILLICAVLNYDLGQYLNLSNQGYISSSMSMAPKSFPSNPYMQLQNSIPPTYNTKAFPPTYNAKA